MEKESNQKVKAFITIAECLAFNGPSSGRPPVQKPFFLCAFSLHSGKQTICLNLTALKF